MTQHPDYWNRLYEGNEWPGGLWMAVLIHEVNGRPGPPHALPMPEMRRLAEACFDVLHLGEAAASHPRRAGREYLMVARKRA